MKETNLILSEIKRVVNQISQEKTDRFIEEIIESKSISVVGSGRSGYVGKSFAMRLGHLGLKKGNDLLIVISGSGKTKESLRIIKRKKVVCLTMNKNSLIAKRANLVIEIKAKKSKQPLRSLFEQSCLVYLDAVIMVLMNRLKVSEKEMWRRHK